MSEDRDDFDSRWSFEQWREAQATGRAPQRRRRSESLVAQARAAGLKPGTVSARLARGASLADALAQPARKPTPARAERPGGRPPKPESVRSLARKHGLHASTLQQRLERGWTLEQAVAKPADSRRRPNTRGIAEAARAAGISRRTVAKRLARGWTLERALSEPAQAPKRGEP